MKILIIPADPDTVCFARDLPNELSSLQQVVGGDVEMVFGRNDEFVMWFHAEGKFAPHRRNERGTALLVEAGGDPRDYIAGDAFISGPSDGEDVPDEVLTRFGIAP